MVAERMSVLAVTNGLPSRSPPIHIPMVIGFACFRSIPCSFARRLYSNIRFGTACRKELL